MNLHQHATVSYWIKAVIQAGQSCQFINIPVNTRARNQHWHSSENMSNGMKIIICYQEKNRGTCFLLIFSYLDFCFSALFFLIQILTGNVYELATSASYQVLTL